MDELWQVPLIALAGVAAGVANVSAGGGSLLTVPLLIFLGLPGPVANGTNRVALIAQNLSAVRSFRGGQVSEWGRGLRLAAVALPGAAAGAVVGVKIGDQLFRQVLGVALLGMLAFTFLRPKPKPGELCCSNCGAVWPGSFGPFWFTKSGDWFHWCHGGKPGVWHQAIRRADV